MHFVAWLADWLLYLTGSMDAVSDSERCCWWMWKCQCSVVFHKLGYYSLLFGVHFVCPKLDDQAFCIVMEADCGNVGLRKVEMERRRRRWRIIIV